MPGRKKENGVTIKARVEGIKEASLPLKAVVYTEEKEEIRILAETKLSADDIKVDIAIEPDDMPETARIVVVPEDIKNIGHIRRIAESDTAPTAAVDRTTLLSREGVLTVEDLAMKPLDNITSIWKLRHKVCGQVFKKDPVTGEKCPVPGATVTVLDVDLNLFWWYPYPGMPWGWLYPYKVLRREEIGRTTTDKCGYFCLEIPYFDIDAVLRWRLRFRCMWEILKPPTILDALDMGIRPDIRYYPELKPLPDLKVRPRPGPIPDPAPVINEMILRRSVEKEASEVGMPARGYSNEKNMLVARELFSQPQFEEIGQELFEKKALFDPLDSSEMSFLERPAFPHSIAAPQLPENKVLAEIMSDASKGLEEAAAEIRMAKPLVRLLRCWPEIVPEWKLFMDIPDIVFKVEQDIDDDGNLEIIYDEGFFDVNWNLNESTSNVEIEAWPNAICVPCGTGYKPCTTAGIVGINDMPLEAAYMDTVGYAIRTNRPRQPVPYPPFIIRPPAETPFCKTLRLVGCPDYGHAAYYKVFYRYEGGPETHFTESWYVYNIAAGTSHHVTPDAAGFYTVLTPPDNYFPYHTLINWSSHRYPDGKYELRLVLYDAAHNPLGAPLPSVKVVIDNSQPAPVDFLKLEYRKGGGIWKEAPLYCPIIKRTSGADVELRIKYNVAATHLRDISIRFSGCDGHIGSDSHWHQSVADNNRILDWTVTLPGTKHEGAYHFYLEGRSRAFNAVGGLASNWYFDPLHIWRGRVLNVVILDK
ncbi:MAG: hypothetical protein JW705_10105 [Methanosarcinaceae archaeon]|nr:hypothetical protein [Methanosarcinaceae archaeon]